jgi:hypothetical protein
MDNVHLAEVAKSSICLTEGPGEAPLILRRGLRALPATGLVPGKGDKAPWSYRDARRVLAFPPSGLAMMARTAADGAGNHGCVPYRAVNSAMFARSIASA